MKTLFMKIILLGFVAGTLTAAGTAANAQLSYQHPDSIRQRRMDQHARIAAGRRNGTLTNREAFRLHSADVRIHGRAMFDRRHDNGHLTVGERHRLNGALNRNSGRIWREKHGA